MRMWPQIIWIILLLIGVGIHLAKHGERRLDDYNIILYLISSAISFALLYFGGFFMVWGIGKP